LPYLDDVSFHTLAFDIGGIYSVEEFIEKFNNLELNTDYIVARIIKEKG